MKNGSDAVGLGARVARAATGRETLVLFERAYHGFDPEFACCPRVCPGRRSRSRCGFRGTTPTRSSARRARTATTLAGIVLNPLDQNPGMDTEAPSADFLAALEAARARTGALLLLDGRCAPGFRLDPKGSHAALGVTPDLLCLGKALGNGHPVAALLGTEALRDGARRILFTATFFFTATSLRAAEAVLEIYDRDAVFARLVQAGERLRAGMVAGAERAGHAIRYSGPPTMPSLRFEDDPGQERGRRFSREAALRGALFHPTLNWFLSAAHDDAAIDEAVAIAAAAFEATPREPVADGR